MEVTTVATGFSFLECPRWHDGRLWVSDFYSHRVVAVDEGGAVETIVSVPGQPSGLGWLPDGRMLVVAMKDHTVMRLEPSGELVEHADLSALVSGHLNDMVVDAQGRAYVGNFGFDLMSGAPMQAGNLVRVDPDGTCTVAAEDLLFPNGTVIDAEGTTMIVAESFGQRLTAFDIGADGTLSNRREWASFGPAPTTTDAHEALASASVAPDGMCLDADGSIWVADAMGQRVLHVAEGGKILDQIEPGTGVYACMLGGEDGRTLFMCAAASFAESERAAATDAALMAARVDVGHAGRP